MAVVRLAQKKFPAARLIFVDLGSPYLVRDAPGADAICVYGAGDAEQEVALDVLQGVTQATGRIPIQNIGARR
jgi:hypothetical protein